MTKKVLEEPIQPLHNDRGKRRCTDVFCLLIFIAFLGGMFGISIWAWSKGDYKRAVNGIDYRGCVCGASSYESGTCKMTDSTSLGNKAMFAASLSSNGDYPTSTNDLFVMCLPSCEATGAQYTSQDVATACYDKTNPNSIIYGSGTNLVDQYNSLNNLCLNDAISVIPKATALFTYCRPTSGDSALTDAINGVLNSSSWTDAFNGIKNGAWIILACAGIAIVLSFLYLIFIQYCAKPFTYLGMVFVLVGLAVSGYLLLDKANSIKDKYGNNDAGYKKDVNWQLSIAGAVICWLFTLLYICFWVFMCKRIKLAIKVIEMASRAVQSAPSLPLVPTLLFVGGILITAVWSVTAVLMFTVGSVESKSLSSLPGGIAREFHTVNDIRWLFLYHAFGFFWVMMFLVAIVEMTTGFVVCGWYFAPRAQNGERIKARLPVARGFWYSLRYHAGSIAFGSAIIAIVKTIRAILEYIDQKTRASGQSNRLVRFAFCCCRCCLWCLEKCLRYINKIAYILIVLSSKSFCSSAGTATKLIMTNFARVGALAFVSNGFLLLGKIFVAAFSTFIGFLIFTRADRYSDTSSPDSVPSPLVPCIVIFVLSWVVASMFMNVLDSATDAMLVAYIYNEEHHVVDAEDMNALKDLNQQACQQQGKKGDDVINLTHETPLKSSQTHAPPEKQINYDE